MKKNSDMKREKYIHWLTRVACSSHYVANRLHHLEESHHLVGNFFHYRAAINILGLNENHFFKDGRLDVDLNSWADFGPLNLHVPIPQSTIEAIKKHVSRKNLNPYPPDLITPVRKAVALNLFLRKRDTDFEVLGTEGAHAALTYAIQTYVDRGDEVIIADPGYFFLEPAIIMAGGKIKRVTIGKENGFCLSPDMVKRKISKRTKMIIVCDPVNPFGSVQSQKDLRELVALARSHKCLLLQNITHSFHQLNTKKQHYPLSQLYKRMPQHVILVSGLSHGVGLAGVRIGFLGAHPRRIREILCAKSALTRINISFFSQYAAYEAIGDKAFMHKCKKILRENYLLLESIVKEVPQIKIICQPAFGYFAAIDTSGVKASCQELTVALLKERCIVYPGDGLGDWMPTSYIRINFSTPFKKHFSWLRRALPRAIGEAERGIYRKAILSFYEKSKTRRARAIIEMIKNNRCGNDREKNI